MAPVPTSPGPGGRLPVATSTEVRSEARRLFRQHRTAMTVVLLLHALAALAGLIAPPVLGHLVQLLSDHRLTTSDADRFVLLLAGAVVLQAVLTRYARYTSFVLGERVFATLRETFVRQVLALPLSTVERAGTGDLVARTTNDVDALSETVRFAVPSVLVAAVTTVLTVGATLTAGPLVALPVFVGVPILWLSTRWYLRRAPEGYLAERAAYAELNGTITESVDGARTVDALGLSERRVARTRRDLATAYGIERYTLGLRQIYFPTVDLAFLLPVSLCLSWGGFLVLHGRADVASVTAVTLYVVQLVEPLDELLSWLDEVQVGASSLARIIGVAKVPPDRTPSGAVPVDESIEARDASFAYRDGHDVLHGVSLSLAPGERLAMVGPSGAGKSTLGRLLAGIHPPRAGRVTVGGVPLVDLSLEHLRGSVALVTQEHHVFVGTLADNLRIARPAASTAQLSAALGSVEALGWATALPDGLETHVGAGGVQLTPPQAQQLALARLVLADPHTLVLDEATSLLDPRAARHLERTLSAVLEGRTVVAIAHRLHTAHDADRVAVVEDGEITELGSHDELLASGGAYAALWRSWQHQPDRADTTDPVG
ncbi:MAG: ABC transporter ATP-binding protein [Actinomycetales bacterium]